MTEAELIRSARQGDVEAFNRLVLQHQDRVYRQAYWMLADPMSADSICQETFLRAYHRLAAFHEESFMVWLLRIAHRLCLDELCRNKRRGSVPPEIKKANGNEYLPAGWPAETQPTPEERADRALMLQQVQQLMERLNPEWRAAMILVDLQGMDYAQCAAILGSPPGTVKSRVAHGRRQLQQLLIACSALAGNPAQDLDSLHRLSHG